MKTLAILTVLMACLVITGRDVQAMQENRLAGTKVYSVRGNEITEVCIDGVVYLILDGYKSGGITAKINADHYPYTYNNSLK